MGMRNLRPLTAVVAAMVVIDAAITPLILGWAAVHLDSLQTAIGPIATEFDYSVMAFRILTMIVFSVWIYQAGTNLIEAGFDDLEFTPGSRIWWYAVPIATFFKPFQGMRELWNASHGITEYDRGSGLVSAWWALWIISNIGNWILLRFSGPEGASAEFSWIMAVVDIGLAAAAIAMIRAIAAAQANLSPEALEEVFA